ncbi:MAG: DUF3536 domain-containing protein [Moorellales bacterium]
MRFVDKYVCIHGHFYQPPRENPWLEEVERQDSAYPFHDWNQRITAECYAPNAWARLLDEAGWIRKLVNNYARISFDFGPTLLSWLERHAPEVYRAIVAADRESRGRFSGHGSALAQAYNHLIMPLAGRRDKHTQIIWGIRDFEHRFGRPPEGMWLPETAVDLETLELMAQEGLVFTVLAPHQARRVRPPGGKTWEEVEAGALDLTRPYLVRLPRGLSLAVFFYDPAISGAVAFGDLLNDGERFARRLLAAFSEAGAAGPQLVSVATDGETFGHHHRFGEMALAYALEYLESRGLARLTNFGEFLERHPPEYEVEIRENTSWSCAHGVERWRGDCGCHSGRHPDWSQAWRAPLRDALNWLRNRLTPEYARVGRQLLKDPWAARNDYISVILDRSPENVDRFLSEHAARPLEAEEQVRALKLLEMQRHLLLMYTSCGWFFDDLSGIETVQILQYAGRALELAREALGLSLEEEFLALLARARSNRPEVGDGARVYERWVKPARADLTRMAAHYALAALFDEPPALPSAGFELRRREAGRISRGEARLAWGRAEIASRLTREAQTVDYVSAYLGRNLMLACLRPAPESGERWELVDRLRETFRSGDLAEVSRLLGTCAGPGPFTWRHLFRDQRQRLLEQLLGGALAAAEAELGRLYQSYAGLLHFLRHQELPLPRSVAAVAELALGSFLRRELMQPEPDPERLALLLEEARFWGIEPDVEEIRPAAEQALTRAAERLARHRRDPAALQALDRTVRAVEVLPWPVDGWPAQKVYYELGRTVYRDRLAEARAGDPAAREWVALFRALGEKLRVRLSQ